MDKLVLWLAAGLNKNVSIASFFLLLLLLRLTLNGMASGQVHLELWLCSRSHLLLLYLLWFLDVLDLLLSMAEFVASSIAQVERLCRISYLVIVVSSSCVCLLLFPFGRFPRVDVRLLRVPLLRVL